MGLLVLSYLGVMASVTVLKGIPAIPADKHELVLNGSEVSKAIEKEGFLDSFYELKQLNYLSINAGLKELPPKFGRLNSVTSLVLHANKLQTLPVEIGEMTKLKHLDVSSNLLSNVPEEISKLSQLSYLNVSMNDLTALPSFRNNVKLASLNASNNKLEIFPDCCFTELSLLSELFLASNQISSIPSEVKKLHSLKVFDIGMNKITEVPPEICLLIKLKGKQYKLQKC